MNRKLKGILTGIAGAGALALTLTGCFSHPNAQQREQAQQQADTTSLLNNQPLPHYNWSQQRATLIDAQNISAQGTQTTSFFFLMGDRDPVFSCPSIGMPVPNTAQLSNPDQVVPVTGSWGGGHDTLPQMEPNGIYAPSNSDGTYTICVLTSGQKYLHYWEGQVMSVSAPAVWNYTKHSIQVTGAPTSVIHTGR